MLKRTFWFALLMAAVVVAGCRATGQTGTQEFTLAYPDADPAPVALDIATGTLTLAAADVEGITGKVTTNVEAWAVTTGPDARGVLRITQGSTRNEVIPNAENLWDIKLGRDRALNLTVNAVSAGGTLDLTGLTLPQLTLNGTTGPFTLNYAAPAPVSGGSIAITMTRGDVTITNLLNSGAARLDATTTSGTQTYEFTGAGLTEHLRANLIASAANIVLRLPAGLPTRIEFTTTTGIVRDLPASFTRLDRFTFENAEYANADQPRVLIEVQTITGSLRVLEMGGL
jgi:hypothetical protein